MSAYANPVCVANQRAYEAASACRLSGETDRCHDDDEHALLRTTRSNAPNPARFKRPIRPPVTPRLPTIFNGTWSGSATQLCERTPGSGIGRKAQDLVQCELLGALSKMGTDFGSTHVEHCETVSA